MVKMKNKWVCVLLVMVIAMQSILPVSAAMPEADATPLADEYFKDYDAYITNENGDITLEFWAQGVSTMSRIGAAVVYIYERADDTEDWRTVKTCWQQSYSYLCGYDVREYGSYVTYDGIDGYEYRGYVAFVAENSSGSSRTIGMWVYP
ncbi:MAG: hypothetical protein IJ315_03060 [Firmicutes bacterium]|nr:hypothetical protein [Bacillota bacterium]